MRHNSSKIAFGWLLFGLGSQLQLWGVSLSFTEFFSLVAGPVLFMTEYRRMKKTGVSFFFWVSILLVISAGLSCFVNHSPMYAVIRGMAVVCLMPCSIVVCHWLLRRNLGGFKWYLVGVAISSVLCTFIFRRSVEVSMWAQGVSDSETTALIMSGPLFWIERLGVFAVLPPKGWYMSCPLLLSAFLPLALSLFSIFTSTSGRSAALGAVAACAIVLLGGKSQSSIKKRICKNIWLIGIIGIGVVLGFYGFYRLSATKGWLGEEAQAKYYSQTRGGTGGIGALLMGGRMDSFCGILACIDHPIVGVGPWPREGGEYVAEFLNKYGTYEDAQRYVEMQESALRYGQSLGVPCHSHITMFWCWFGIGGLIFILYVLFVHIRYFCQDCWAIPQWFMWLAAGLPAFLWGVFFSPVTGRTGLALVSVAVLMARAVRRGRQPLPIEMIDEILKKERK